MGIQRRARREGDGPEGTCSQKRQMGFEKSNQIHLQSDLELMQFGTLKILLAQQLCTEVDLEVGV